MIQRIFIFLFFPLSLFSQEVEKAKSIWPKTNFSLVYYGNNVSNPGINFGIEHAILENGKTKIKTKRGIQKVKYKTTRIEIVPTLGFYVDPGSHTALFGKLNGQLKKISDRHWTFITSLGLGYNVNFLPNVYTVTNQSVSKNPSTKARAYFAPEFKIGLGKVKLRNEKLRGWLLNLSSQFLFDYNDSILILPALELGIRIK